MTHTRTIRAEAGFTLVELMVVVLIIGILVAVAIPVFYSATATVAERSCQSNLRTLDGAVEQWKAASPINDPAGWLVLADAKTHLEPYVKDWDSATACPNTGSYTTSITVVADAPDLCTFRCPNGHVYGSE